MAKMLSVLGSGSVVLDELLPNPTPNRPPEPSARPTFKPARSRAAARAREGRDAGDVHDGRGGEPETCGPQRGGPPSQRRRVAVRDRGAREHCEVPGHVQDHPDREQQTGHGHERLRADGRSPEVDERAHTSVIPRRLSLV